MVLSSSSLGGMLSARLVGGLPGFNVGLGDDRRGECSAPLVVPPFVLLLPFVVPLLLLPFTALF